MTKVNALVVCVLQLMAACSGVPRNPARVYDELPGHLRVSEAAE